MLAPSHAQGAALDDCEYPSSCFLGSEPFSILSMQKNNDSCSEGALLRYSVFDRASGFLARTPIEERDTSEFKEFGVSASEALTNDVLIKKLADETVSLGTARDSIRTVVYLCFNWKICLPFVVVERAKKNVRARYSAQYGRDDNYNDYSWTNTTFRIYSVDEHAKLEPESAQLLKQLE